MNIDIEKETPLIQAFFNKNRQLAVELITNGADINTPESFVGYSPLMLACGDNDEELVKILLDHGADVSIKSKNGLTALINASKNNKKKICELLIKSNPNILEKDGPDAFVKAARAGHIEIINYLISKGLNINTKNTVGETALMVAANRGNINLVKELLKLGADINQKDDHGKTALIHAAIGGVVSFIREEGSPGPEMDEIEKALAEMQELNGVVISFLIESGAKIQEEDNYGLTAVEHARRNGKKNIVKILESAKL